MTSDTIFGPNGNHLFLFIKFQDMLGAEMNTNPAPLAPFPIDKVSQHFLFGHICAWQFIHISVPPLAALKCECIVSYESQLDKP
jgi:hypothetical protein